VGSQDHKKAIPESIFFIPIVTPSALASAHCRFKFNRSSREKRRWAGITSSFQFFMCGCPALEKEDQWRRDDVLRVIGSRQYLDWQRVRDRSFTEAEVAEKIAHSHKIVKRYLDTECNGCIRD
jgi:hypothetical protein